jgi:hypothetical protein
VLFSQPEIADFLSESFECAWESVRPVPRLSIDFGGGRRLERTLRGNIATYLCTGAGETFDLVPGLVEGREYVERLREGLALFERMRAKGLRNDAGAPGPIAGMVHTWHRRFAHRDGLLGGAPAGPDDPVRVVPWQTPSNVGRDRNVSKGLVEQPLEGALVPPLTPGAPLALHELLAPPAPGAQDALGLDTLDARNRGYREAHDFIARSGMKSPAEITHAVYRELLHVDLADPYLGLAPDVLGGEVGRH